MFNKELCKKIGQLLKKADELQIYYYKTHNKLSVKEMPSELIGSKCLSIVQNRPVDGIKFLQQKADPFIRFCNAQRKKQAINWKEAYGKMDSFKILLQEVLERINYEEDCLVDSSSKNIINLQYLI